MAKLIVGENERELADGSAIRDAAEELGVPFGCKQGICGTCKIDILEGSENKLKDNDGNTFSLKDIASEYVVVYFYPRDSTPGCTVEAISRVYENDGRQTHIGQSFTYRHYSYQKSSWIVDICHSLPSASFTMISIFGP